MHLLFAVLPAMVRRDIAVRGDTGHFNIFYVFNISYAINISNILIFSKRAGSGLRQAHPRSACRQSGS